MNATKLIISAILLTIVFAALVNQSEATYRKPPFNGSIFGKRGSSADYDSASKALSAMCEIANEACQSWFPGQDK
ncbi:SIFamide [Carabus blaptoides fortunei]